MIHLIILLHDWEGNTGEYSVRGWQYWSDCREEQYITRELNIPLYCPTQKECNNMTQIWCTSVEKKICFEEERKRKGERERKKKKELESPVSRAPLLVGDTQDHLALKGKASSIIAMAIKRMLYCMASYCPPIDNQ